MKSVCVVAVYTVCVVAVYTVCVVAVYTGCVVAVYTVCMLMLLLCWPVMFSILQFQVCFLSLCVDRHKKANAVD